MEKKYTPGPWITFQPRGDGSVPVRTSGLGLTICYVHDGAVCDAITNAHLIAAAPDLLEALEDCKEMADVMAGMTGCRGDDDWVWGIQAKIDAAIRKAYGEGV